MRTRVGHIQFLNSFPLFYGLIEKRVLLDFDLIKGRPSELNWMLAAGELDIAPISSIEYARHHKEYILIPDIAIAANGIVKSILLISKVPWKELGGKRVALANTSAASQALLKILMARKYGLDVNYFESPPDLNAMLMEADAALLIGDDAMRADLTLSQKMFVYDLGQEWQDYNGHAMVFAVWAVRRDYAQAYPEQVKRVKDALLESMAFSLQHLQDVAKKAAEWEVFTPQALEEYFATLCFDFGDRQQAGLLAYYREAFRQGLLEEVPQLMFLEA